MKNESTGEIKYRLKYFYLIDIDSLLENCMEQTSLEDILNHIMSECIEYNNFLNPTLTPISLSFFGEIRETNAIQSYRNKTIQHLKHHCILFYYYYRKKDITLDLRATNSAKFQAGFIKSQEKNIGNLHYPNSVAYNKCRMYLHELSSNNYEYQIIQELSGFDSLKLEKHSYIKIPGLYSPFINQVYTESYFKCLNKRIDKVRTEKKINRTDFSKIINGMNFIRKNPENMDNIIDLLYSAAIKEYYYPLSLLIRANKEIRFMHKHDSPHEDLRGKRIEDIILATGEMTNVFSRQLFLEYGLYCYSNTPTFYSDFLEHDNRNPKKTAVSILENYNKKDIANRTLGQALLIDFIKTISKVLIPLLEQCMIVIFSEIKIEDLEKKLEEYIKNNLDDILEIWQKPITNPFESDFKEKYTNYFNLSVTNYEHNIYSIEDFCPNYLELEPILLKLLENHPTPNTLTSFLHSKFSDNNCDTVIKRFRKEHSIILQEYLRNH